MGEQIVQGHLGGYVAGGDLATWYPELWTWLVHDLGITSMIDLGCGEGHALKFFRDVLNCRVYGIEGIPQNDSDIHQHDFEIEPWLGSVTADLVWTCEFVEHVDEKYAYRLVPVFQCAPLVLITHAFPGQGGHHHVNCQNPEYWQGFMSSFGYVKDIELTITAQRLSGLNTDPWNHFLRSGVIFRSTI